MKNGFTLVELSIVLVIIGLLIGGILVGQSLIDSAKINQAIRQIQQYDIAVSNFQERFKQLPGDTNLLTPAGNNDKTLSDDYEVPGGVGTCGANQCRERMSFWKHLSDANILQESYPIDSGPCSEAKNCPLLLGTNLSVIYRLLDSSSIGAKGNSYLTTNVAESLSGIEALAIDNKIDDGDGASGDIRHTDENEAIALPCTTTSTLCSMVISIMSTNGGQ